VSKKGFTILEILVVLSVIAILIGIAVPRLKGMQDQANISKAKAELRALQAAIVSYYTNTSPNAYPPTSTTVGATYLTTATPQIISSPLYDPWGATSTTEYKYVLSSNGKYYVIGSVGPNGTIGSCFAAGTEIMLATGTTKTVEKLQIGDILLGSNGAKNKVLDIGVMPKEDRKIYSFNGGDYFVTADHPFSTKAGGWAALDPKLAEEMHPGMKTDKLDIGTELMTHNGSLRVEKIDFKAVKDSVVYNPQLDGSHDYYADGFLVHNNAPPPSFGIGDDGVVTGKAGDDICVTNGSGC